VFIDDILRLLIFVLDSCLWVFRAVWTGNKQLFFKKFQTNSPTSTDNSIDNLMDILSTDMVVFTGFQ